MEALLKRYQKIRQKTEALCAPLETEDYVIQSIEDTSPPKWHLAHTTWFFETFVLVPYLKNYSVFDPSFNYLFNSYYHTLNNPYPRSQRGLLSRPTVKKIYDYRHSVNKHIEALLSEKLSAELLARIELGLNHEQQHQELLLMDIKHNFFQDKNFPVYQTKITNLQNAKPASDSYINHQGGLVDIGFTSTSDFCFDNELPQHKIILTPFSIRGTLVTNEEYLAFIEDKGYAKPILWLSDGWEAVLRNKWKAPLYWQKSENHWHMFTLQGLQPLNLKEPVTHVSYYEADAFARWAGKRLPLETEWEHSVKNLKLDLHQGNFLESDWLHPQVASNTQFFGDVWEWTASAYSPYPGFQIAPGALGEYNGKFMSNQFVLRGGSCVTPRTHIRVTYRNFFQPEKRWQFSGIRLCEDPT